MPMVGWLHALRIGERVSAGPLGRPGIIRIGHSADREAILMVEVHRRHWRALTTARYNQRFEFFHVMCILYAQYTMSTHFSNHELFFLLLVNKVYECSIAGYTVFSEAICVYFFLTRNKKVENPGKCLTFVLSSIRSLLRFGSSLVR